MTPRFRVRQLGIEDPPQSYCTTFAALVTGYYYFGDNLLSDYDRPMEGDLLANYVYVNGKRLVQSGTMPANVRFFIPTTGLCTPASDKKTTLLRPSTTTEPGTTMITGEYFCRLTRRL